ncbi:MAG TPA: alpha/beta hydrolase fold domain-containing protein [Polyangiales bacterium]|jgi:acetyl esterase|nr:alpha/beta hydrolase fold domain-containing protein [Polyangiales bacterium]
MPQSRFSGPFGDIELRVHRAAGSGDRALVFFHDASTQSFPDSSALCDVIAHEAECAVLAVDSERLSAPRFPGSVDEAYFIACHLHEHADDLGADHRKLAIGGEGFGATLATAASRLAKERRNPSLAWQWLLHPVLDLRDPPAGLASFAQRYAPSEAERADPRASPLAARNLIGLASAIVIARDASPEREQAQAYVLALQKAYVQARLVLGEPEQAPGGTSAPREGLLALREVLGNITV